MEIFGGLWFREFDSAVMMADILRTEGQEEGQISFSIDGKYSFFRV